MGWAVITNMAHQALGMSAKASLLAIGRQGMFFIPLILLLPLLFGLTGVQLAQPSPICALSCWLSRSGFRCCAD